MGGVMAELFSSLYNIAQTAREVVTSPDGVTQQLRHAVSTNFRKAYYHNDYDGRQYAKGLTHPHINKSGQYDIFRHFQEKDGGIPLKNFQIMGFVDFSYHDFQSCDFTNADFLKSSIKDDKSIDQYGEFVRKRISGYHEKENSNTGLEKAFFSVEDVIARVRTLTNSIGITPDEIALVAKLTVSVCEIYRSDRLSKCVIQNPIDKGKEFRSLIESFVKHKDIGSEKFSKNINEFALYNKGVYTNNLVNIGMPLEKYLTSYNDIMNSLHEKELIAPQAGNTAGLISNPSKREEPKPEAGASTTKVPTPQGVPSAGTEVEKKEITPTKIGIEVTTNVVKGPDGDDSSPIGAVQPAGTETGKKEITPPNTTEVDQKLIPSQQLDGAANENIKTKKERKIIPEGFKKEKITPAESQNPNEEQTTAVGRLQKEKSKENLRSTS
jgi:hypothetical protein